MLGARLVTATALLVLFAAGMLLLPTQWWGILLLPVLAAAALEWGALARYRAPGRWLFACAIVISALAFLYWEDAGAAWVHAVGWLSVAFWFVVAPAWLAGKWRVRNGLREGVVGWIVLVPAWLALVELQSNPLRLLMVLGVVWVADSAAYFVGRRFGRRRLAPEISPGKTWEGVAGACAAVAVYHAVLWQAFSLQQPSLFGPGGIVLVAFVTVMSIEGDLFESWLKRQAGVKDSGTLLPGHGGVLDRIDGLIASLPFAMLWLTYFS